MSLFADEKPQNTPAPPRFNLASMGEAALLDLRAQIDACLPVKSLKDLDLERELVLQYQTVKALQNIILNDGEVPVNQRAQVANSCASTLDALVKMQEKYATGERLKQIEARLIETLNRMPENTTKDFFSWYEDALNG